MEPTCWASPPIPTLARLRRRRGLLAPFPATASAEGRLIKGGPSPARGKEQNSSGMRLSYRPLTDAMNGKDMPFEVCYGSLDLNAQAVMTCLAYSGIRVTQGTTLIAGLLQQG